jgi:hypothetical protein
MTMPPSGGGDRTNHNPVRSDRNAPHRQLQRRQHAAARLPPLECGCRDPWLCRCDGDPLGEALSRTASPPLSLTAALDALRRAWMNAADDADKATLKAIADVLTEKAEAP